MIKGSFISPTSKAQEKEGLISTLALAKPERKNEMKGKLRANPSNERRVILGSDLG